MPFGRFMLKPGIETRLSQSANQGGWSASQLVRFLGGLPQKLGGWTHMNSTALTGTARSLHAWSDLNGIPYLAAGTEQRLQILANGAIQDITPLQASDDVAVDFSTVINTPTVTIVDSSNPAVAGNWVMIPVVVSVGGLLIDGFHQIQSVIDANTYTITAAGNATATVNNGGAVPAFTTTNTFATVTVTLANHGLSAGDLFDVPVSTTVATVVISDTYNVTSVTDASHFVITASSVANANATRSENGGDVRLDYLLQNGFASDTAVSGYGVGLYGAGLYGVGSGTLTEPLRWWSLVNWGQLLIASYNGGAIYTWTPPTVQPAAILATGPQIQTGIFLFGQQQVLVSFGSSTTPSGGTQDPMIVRWSDVLDYTDWDPTTTNQAGSFRLPTGSMIIGALFASQQAILFTDTDAYSMTYCNLPFVFSFNLIGRDCGMIAPQAAGMIGFQLFWMSYRNFYTLGAGGAQAVPCPVWDQVFGNLYASQLRKIICATNSLFNEIAWFYPAAGGTGEIDSYVKYNTLEQVWDYGTLERTAWCDESVFGSPVGVDGGAILQQHEVGNDADGMPLTWFVESGFLDIASGEDFSFIDQFYPDVAAATTAGAQLQITIKTTAYADDTPVIDGPYLAPFPTNLITTRSRGRQAAVRFGSSDLGSFIRLGNIRFRFSDDGAN